VNPSTGANVRPAEPADFDAVTALLEELGRPVVTDRDACRAVYESQLADETACHLVAYDESGNLTGFCSLHFRTRLNHTTLEAWVPDLIVSEAARRRGTAIALLSEAERLARERGCHQLTLESAHFRKPAHALYTAFGMDQPGLTFGKPLL
jgi:GNAT superfamily N-acetyltransferase